MTTYRHHASRIQAMYAPTQMDFKKWGAPLMRTEGMKVSVALLAKFKPNTPIYFMVKESLWRRTCAEAARQVVHCGQQIVEAA
jgi:hypothetical protein